MDDLVSCYIVFSDQGSSWGQSGGLFRTFSYGRFFPHIRNYTWFYDSLGLNTLLQSFLSSLSYSNLVLFRFWCCWSVLGLGVSSVFFSCSCLRSWKLRGSSPLSSKKEKFAIKWAPLKTHVCARARARVCFIRACVLLPLFMIL